MTAQIAIMNKSAIALASDSAATILQSSKTERSKIYYSSEKLFRLSDFSPVAVMVYGNAEFLGVPWETIIKVYSSKIQGKFFSTLVEYVKDFLTFLDQIDFLFPAELKEREFLSFISSYFMEIKDEIDEEVKARIAANQAIDSTEVEIVVLSIIKKHYEKWEKLPDLNNIITGFSKGKVNWHTKRIIEIANSIFKKLPILSESVEQLIKIAVNLFCKDGFYSKRVSGLIIAGFGENETYPSLFEFVLETAVINLIKFKQVQLVNINAENPATIIPFAQREIVDTFIEGINPYLKGAIEGYLHQIFEDLPDKVCLGLDILPSEERETLLERLKQEGEINLIDFIKNFTALRRNMFIDPILEAVRVLPKDELASMAESLVNITSFRRRISMDAETVGGPIDVAVISKGDGFVWIKRKQYFSRELNSHFSNPKL